MRIFIRKIKDKPDLAAILFVWSGAALVHLLLYGLSYNISPSTWLYLLICYLLTLLPLFFGKDVPREFDQLLERKTRKIIRVNSKRAFVLYIMLGLSLLSALVFFWSNVGSELTSSLGPATFSEIRQEHVQQLGGGSGGEGGGVLGYLYYLTAPFLVFTSLLLVYGSFSLLVRLFGIITVSICLVISVLSTGGRADILLLSAVCGFCGLLCYRLLLVKHTARSIFIMVCFMVIALSGLSYFQYLRADPGTRHLTLNLYSMRAGEILDRYGIQKAPLPVEYALSNVGTYFAKPFFFFDVFLDKYDADPTYGAYNFRLIGRRFEGLGLAEKKRQIDLIYYDIGIGGNVWATGFRELIVDFSKYAVPFVCFLLATIVNLMRAWLKRSLGALFIYCLLSGYLILLPFMSLMVHRGLEMSLYYAALLLYFEVVSGKNLLYYFAPEKRSSLARGRDFRFPNQ